MFQETASVRNTQEVDAQIILRNAASYPRVLQIHKAQQHINLRSPSVNHLFNLNPEHPELVTKELSSLLSSRVCAHLRNFRLDDLRDPSAAWKSQALAQLPVPTAPLPAP